MQVLAGYVYRVYVYNNIHVANVYGMHDCSINAYICDCAQIANNDSLNVQGESVDLNKLPVEVEYIMDNNRSNSVSVLFLCESGTLE